MCEKVIFCAIFLFNKKKKEINSGKQGTFLTLIISKRFALNIVRLVFKIGIKLKHYIHVIALGLKACINAIDLLKDHIKNNVF